MKDPMSDATRMAQSEYGGSEMPEEELAESSGAETSETVAMISKAVSVLEQSGDEEGLKKIMMVVAEQIGKHRGGGEEMEEEMPEGEMPEEEEPVG